MGLDTRRAKPLNPLGAVQLLHSPGQGGIMRRGSSRAWARDRCLNEEVAPVTHSRSTIFRPLPRSFLRRTMAVADWGRLMGEEPSRASGMLEYFDREEVFRVRREDDGLVTVEDEDMINEELSRKNKRLRQKRYLERRKRDGNIDGNVTPDETGNNIIIEELNNKKDKKEK